jgi:hypothetical protein
MAEREHPIPQEPMAQGQEETTEELADEQLEQVAGGTYALGRIEPRFPSQTTP